MKVIMHYEVRNTGAFALNFNSIYIASDSTNDILYGVDFK